MDVDEITDEITQEINFIKSNFKIRVCDKYCGQGFEKCYCNHLKREHKHFPDSVEWSYDGNTVLKVCDTYGSIRFIGSDVNCLKHRPKFIRFDFIDQPTIYECVYKLLCKHWKVRSPKLIITINGGFERMNFKTNQMKKNFKQGLIDVMKKDDTWIIGGGVNIGIHKLVIEAVQEYRLHQENSENKVTLIGITSWSRVYNNHLLLPVSDVDGAMTNRRKYKYPSTISDITKKVALDPHYDYFLFCDDGTVDKYDKEMDFRMELEKYVVNQENAFIVQILFEGGTREIFSAYETLRNNISIVVIKGSGRAADILSEVLELPNRKFSTNIKAILDEYKDQLNITADELSTLQDNLLNIYTKYKKQIFIHNMYDPNMKLDKSILEAIISRRDGTSLEQTLKLTIRFNCPSIADKKVFINTRYPTIEPGSIKLMFLDVLRSNKAEFVRLFLQNGLEIESVINRSVLTGLYTRRSNVQDTQCFELLHDLLSNNQMWLVSQTTKGGNERAALQAIGAIIPGISGNILKPLYTREKEPLPQNDVSLRRKGNNSDVELLPVSYAETVPRDNSLVVTAHDMLLWALLLGHTELAEIFWEIGKDHVGSALVASTILKNMASLTVKRGDIDLEKKLTTASQKFQDFATNIVTEAYNRSKTKTYIMLIRALKRWDDMTCIQIAISGGLLDFLNNSACGSYAMKVWMGNMSPFLSYWKILINIPFSVLFIKRLIIPYLNNEDIEVIHPPVVVDNGMDNTLSIGNTIDTVDPPPIRTRNVPCGKAIKTFYTAPIVKFTINLMSYITFLLIFSYMNLCELKFEYNSIKERWAETFVCIYVVALCLEEIRQVIDQERTGNIIYKFYAYRKGSWNFYDIILINVFIFTVIVRYTVDSEKFVICRCLFAISLCMFCIRTMQFYFVNKSIGPKVIMIRDMIRDVVFFLSIFAIFILSYGTLAHSLNKPNSDVSIFLLKDIVYLPYFQTYGEVMLDKFEVFSCNSTECMIRDSTVMIGFAIFLLLTNILLINLLIAMFGYTFNQIQGNSRKHWSFIKIQLIEEFYEKPILPPPFNLVYYVFKGFLWLFNICCGQKDKQIDNLLVKSLSDDENFRICSYEQVCMEAMMSETNTLRVPSNSGKDEWMHDFAELMDTLTDTPGINATAKKPELHRMTSLQKRKTGKFDKFFDSLK